MIYERFLSQRDAASVKPKPVANHRVVIIKRYYLGGFFVSGNRWNLVVARVKLQSFRLRKFTWFSLPPSSLLLSNKLTLSANRAEGWWKRRSEEGACHLKGNREKESQPKQRWRCWSFTHKTLPIWSIYYHDFVPSCLPSRGKSLR